ncbi:MAG TPA: aldo/keto reductase [Alkalispirochaeta sp.]|nr:aldo/keto reductase [Alkalispirochaeta sp.]
METRTFGDTGLEISEVGLGAWPLGGSEAGLGSYGPIDEKIAVATVRRYLDLGGNFIDSARAYGPSETYIGKALVEGAYDREAVIIASKTASTTSWDDVPNIRKDLETTLRELQTEYVDLYQLHTPPEDSQLRERIIDEFEILREEGKINHIGASVKGPSVTDATVALSRSYIETHRIDALQLIYSIFRTRTEQIFDESAATGVGLIIRTSLESGFLSGKYSPNTDFSTGHRARWSKAKTERLLKVAEELKQIAVHPPYNTLAQVALKFALQDPRITCIIPGAKSPEQCEANIAVAELPDLSPELIETLREYHIEDVANP